MSQPFAAPGLYTGGMSTYNWESGSVRMSTREFAQFRRGMVQFHNDRQERLYKDAVALWAGLRAQAKGQRNFDYGEALRNHRRFDHSGSPHRGVDSMDGFFEIEQALIDYNGTGSRRSLKCPKKKDFKTLKLTAESIPVGYEAVIGFDNKAREVRWDVPENNHAVERARESAVGREFLGRLAAVRWTRGTGGQFVGTDEYNEDRRDAGGGANYVTARYGPLGQDATSRHKRKS